MLKNNRFKRIFRCNLESTKKAGAEQFSGYSTPTIDKEPEKSLSFIFWLGWQDSNLRNARIKIWCLTDLAISPYYHFPTKQKKMGWVVGFEPTYTGATTLGLNHLTIPTMLVFFTSDCVALSRCGADI